MANRRVYDLQRIVSNGVAIPGARTLGLEAAYSTVLESDGDGAYGGEDVDRGGLSIPVSLEVSDVLAVADVLTAVPGTTTFSGRESGAGTWKNYTIGGGSAIVWLGAAMRLGKTRDSSVSYEGRVRFAGEATALDDVIALAASAGSPTNSFSSPTRYWLPKVATFSPYAGGSIAPLHVDEFEFSLRRNVIADWGDNDVGETAVDGLNWGALTFSLTHRDAHAVSPGDMQAALLGAGRGVLTIRLSGRGGAGDQILTINNVLLTAAPTNHQREYGTFTLRGSAGWKKREGGTVDYSIAGEVVGTSRLFSYAAA